MLQKKYQLCRKCHAVKKGYHFQHGHLDVLDSVLVCSQHELEVMISAQAEVTLTLETFQKLKGST